VGVIPLLKCSLGQRLRSILLFFGFYFLVVKTWAYSMASHPWRDSRMLTGGRRSRVRGQLPLVCCSAWARQTKFFQLRTKVHFRATSVLFHCVPITAARRMKCFFRFRAFQYIYASHLQIMEVGLQFHHLPRNNIVRPLPAAVLIRPYNRPEKDSHLYRT
jgi:hypothetical protein